MGRDLYPVPVRAQDPRVPQDVEAYLVELNARAGQVGGGRAGARGGARGARRLKTRVEERSGVVLSTANDVRARLAAAEPKLIDLDTQGGLVRFAVPLGLTGLNHIVVDLTFRDHTGSATTVNLRAHGKEGLLNRQPTAKTADRLWAVITN
jgi:hypothetical protein